METIHVTFDELTEQQAPRQASPGPVPNILSPGPISSGLVQNPTPATPFMPPTSEDWKKLFDPMFDEYFEPQNVAASKAPVVPQLAGAAHVPPHNVGPSTSLSLNPEGTTISHSVSTSNVHSSSV